MRKIVKIKVKVVPRDGLASDGTQNPLTSTKRPRYRGELVYDTPDGTKAISTQTTWFPSKEQAIDSLAASVLNEPALLRGVLQEYAELINLVSDRRTPITPRDILYSNGVDAIKSYVLVKHIEKEMV